MLENSPSFSALYLSDLSLAVRLGCSAEERSAPQEVRVSIEMRFSKTPQGVFSDALSDTVCYARISQALQAHCESREFNLIEHMAFDIYGLTREVAGADVAIGVLVHKVRPPVKNLIGGSKFRYGDFIP